MEKENKCKDNCISEYEWCRRRCVNENNFACINFCDRIHSMCLIRCVSGWSGVC